MGVACFLSAEREFGGYLAQKLPLLCYVLCQGNSLLESSGQDPFHEWDRRGKLLLMFRRQGFLRIERLRPTSFKAYKKKKVSVPLNYCSHQENASNHKNNNNVMFHFPVARCCLQPAVK